MAVTARFQADFASFYSAIQKADTQLKGLETGAGRVSTSLNRMVNSFSGRKIIQDATLATEAVNRIGGVTKLTTAEQRKLSATLSEGIAKFKALGMDVPPQMQALADATRNAEKPTRTFTDTFKATLAGFVSAQAILGGVRVAWRTLSAFVASSVESFAAAEAAQKKLTTALTAQGTTAPRVIQQYQALGAEFQRTTKYSDDLIAEMQGLLVQVGNVMPSQMKGALTAATDLASGLGVDLRTAVDLVAKAFEIGRVHV